MSSISNNPLGQKSEYPEQYDPRVLYPISRALGRSAIAVPERWPFYGEDLWNAYELSWLEPSGKPRVGMLELRVPADSPCIVESKSLKLYLGSFNQTIFESAAKIEAVIAQDVGHIVGAPIQTTLMTLDAPALTRIVSLPGDCIDSVEAEGFMYEVQPDFLQGDSHKIVSETLHSHLLRSCCPVTGQPDWASLLVRYRGPQLDRAGLLKYVVSYRNNQEFHEQCVERIFTDIHQHCQPEQLTVSARYTRRGGIDINPWRSTEADAINNGRLVRQ